MPVRFKLPLALFVGVAIVGAVGATASIVTTNVALVSVVAAAALELAAVSLIDVTAVVLRSAAVPAMSP